MPPVRRKLEELVALYQLEPTLRDVFVEGAEDKIVIDWYLRQRTNKDFTVYDIDSVDVPRGLVEHHNHPVGNSGRVRTLAAHLDQVLQDDERKCPTLVSDADRDYLLGQQNSCELLLLTDFADLEMYLFSESSVDRFVSIVLRGCSYSANVILQEMKAPLMRLFLIKAASITENLHLTWIDDFTAVCRIAGSTIAFDEGEFVKRYCHNSGQAAQVQRIHDKVRDLDGSLTGDERLRMSGDDYMTMLRWYLRRLAVFKRPMDNKDVFYTAFMGCVDIVELDTSRMFPALLARIAE